MKLFRLHTENSNIFKTDIQNSLILPKQSQVCLLNMNFEKFNEEIVISNDNHELKYSIGTYTQAVYLTHANYNESNIKDLVRDMEKQLNKSMSYNNSSITGMRWDIRPSSAGGALNIDTDYSSLIDPFGTENYTDNGLSNNSVIGPPARNFYQKTSNTTEGIADAGLFSNTEKFKDNFEHITGSACTLFKVIVGKLSSNGDGFHVSISNIKGESMGGLYDFVPNKISYGIYAKNLNSFYEIITPTGGLVTTTLLPENAISGNTNNDVITLGYKYGKIVGTVFQASNPNGVVLFEEEYDISVQGIELYPIIGVYQQAEVELQNIRIATEIEYDDYGIKKPAIEQINDVGSSIIPGVPTQVLGQKNPMTFQFQSQDMAKTFGFTQQILEVGPDDVFRLKGNTPISFLDNSEAYIVELMNLKLDSYDSFKQQRESIIAFIQNSREKNQPDVLYQANNLIFIDLNNDYEIPLRNIDARILTSDYLPVKIQGEANLVLLFKSKDERL